MRPRFARRGPSVPEGVRIYAIGDIHGRSDLLDRMHARIEADLDANAAPSPHLIYLGDYIDRGPDSSGVLERLASGPLRGLERTLLRGNHEQMLMHFLEGASSGTTWRQLGGLDTLMSYGVNVGAAPANRSIAKLAEEFKQKLPQHHLELLQSLKNYVSVGGYFFCHAGVRPGVPLEVQKNRDLLWIRDDFLFSKANFGKVIVHGHTPVEKPEIRSNRINIDTGAYATGRLTCLVLQGRHRHVMAT